MSPTKEYFYVTSPKSIHWSISPAAPSGLKNKNKTSFDRIHNSNSVHTQHFRFGYGKVNSSLSPPSVPSPTESSVPMRSMMSDKNRRKDYNMFESCIEEPVDMIPSQPPTELILKKLNIILTTSINLLALRGPIDPLRKSSSRKIQSHDTACEKLSDFEDFYCLFERVCGLVGKVGMACSS
nr:hypothetical protein L203_02070 [Cryptococcus depauperatus CBS 7841]